MVLWQVMKIHQLQGYIQFVYLVEYPDKLLLLDGCSRADIPMLQGFIEQTLQRPFADLKLLVVTHMHPDHAGGAHLIRQLSGCKIAAAKRKTQWYGGIHGTLMFISDMILAWYMATKLKKPRVNILYCPYLYPDFQLPHGAVLPDFADWQVLETQGHTDRDLSLYHAQSRTAYTADLIIKLRKSYVPPFPIFYPQDYRRSLELVKNLPIETLLLAHGGRQTVVDDSWYRQIIAKTPRRALHLRSMFLSRLRFLWRKIMGR